MSELLHPRLVLASDLAFDPVQAAAQRFAFLGASGSGKSYGCGRLVEQLHATGVPVVILDTVGIWPALRLAADGKKPGLPFVIIGGEHADVPLDLMGGQKLARFLVEHDASAVLDLSDHTPDERAPFVAELCETVLIAIKARRRPRVFVFDEAQDMAPEKPGRGEARMLKAVSALIRKGRNHLCGTVLLSQRPQDVSKTALNQVGNLFVGALFGKHERDAVRDWAGQKARSELVDGHIKALPALPPGEFFFWSPQWLHIYQRIHILPKWTYDGSSSTPLANSAELGKVAPVDVKALRALLSPAPTEPEPVAQSKRTTARGARSARTDGPTPLRPEGASNRRIDGQTDHFTPIDPALIAELVDIEVANMQSRLAEVESENAVLVELMTEGNESLGATLATLRMAVDSVAQALEAVRTLFRRASERARFVQGKRPESEPVKRSPVSTPVVRPPSTWLHSVVTPGQKTAVKRPPVPASGVAVVRAPTNGLPKVDRNILAVLAWQSEPVTRARLALLTGSSAKGGNFKNGLSRQRVAGHLEGSALLSITPAGRKAVGPVLKPPTGAALFEWWLEHPRVDKPMSAILTTLRAARMPLDRDALSEGAQFSRSSAGNFKNALSRLRVLGLVLGKGKELIRLADELRAR